MVGYNRITGYNKARYNADGAEIIVADTLILTDGVLIKSLQKTLTDLTVFSESVAKQQNKSVTETIKLDVWQSQDRSDSSLWSD